MVLRRIMVMVVVMMIVMAGGVRGQSSGGTAEMQALRAALLTSYDKDTLPIVDDKPIEVNVSGFVIRNLYMDERKHQVHLNSWITFTWTDHRLRWNPEENGGVKKLTMNPDDLWMPDLTVYNSGNAANTPLFTSKARVIVYPNGSVLQVPPLDILYNCVADMTYWPHDEHVCRVKIGSWVHDGYLIDFHLPNELKPTLEVTKEPEGEMSTLQWEIGESSSIKRKVKYYVCCEEPYVLMAADLVLVRMAPAYTWLIKIPVVCFTLLSLVIFLLPPDAGEKVTFGGIVLLLHFIFLIFSNDSVRSAPTHTPLIIQLVVVELVLVTASVVVAAVVVRMARAPSNSSPPPSALTSLARSLASPLRLSNYVQATEKDTTASSSKTEELELAQDGEAGASKGTENSRVAGAQWMLVAAFLDRLALVLCFLAIIVVLASFSTVI